MSDFLDNLSNSLDLQGSYMEHISNEKYHAITGCASSSVLKGIAIGSPLEAFHEKRENKGMEAGDLVHKYLLEPNVFEKEMSVIEKGETLAEKAAWSISKRGGPTSVHGENIKGLIDYLGDDKCSSLRKLIAASAVEVSYFWKGDGVNCKARADILNLKSKTIFDIKFLGQRPSVDVAGIDTVETSKSGIPETGTSGRLEDIRYSTFWNLRYDIQAAFYLDGMRQIKKDDSWKFAFIFIIGVAPFEWCIVNVSDEILDIGRYGLNRVYGYKAALETFKECYHGKKWGNFEGKVFNLKVPAWL